MPEENALRILVVDDEDATPICDALERVGLVECVPATTAIEAISMSSIQEYDLVVMDMRLPFSDPDSSVSEEDDVKKRFIEFSQIGQIDKLFRESNVGGWWCAAFMVENINWVTKEKILFVTQYTEMHTFEPFKRTDKLGIYVRDRIALERDAKHFIERLGCNRFLEWTKLQLDGGMLDRGTVLKIASAFDVVDWGVIHGTHRLTRYFPYSREDQQYCDAKIVAKKLRELCLIPVGLDPTLLMQLTAVYGNSEVKERAYAISRAIVEELLTERTVLHAGEENESSERWEHICRLQGAKLLKYTLIKYVSLKLGRRDSRLRQCVLRLVILATFVEMGKITEPGILEIDAGTIKGVGALLGFARRTLTGHVAEMVHFRKIRTELCLTHERIPQADFFPQEKEWLFQMHIDGVLIQRKHRKVWKRDDGSEKSSSRDQRKLLKQWLGNN